METNETVKQKENLINLYLNKSKESFLLAVEIMNKPTIKYRIETYSFLICTAWDLLLKCFVIKTKSDKDIYYKEDNTRTKSLSKLLKDNLKEKDPIRINLEFIINEIRDVSTHKILTEHEKIYFPILQASAINYIAFLDNILGDSSLKKTKLFYWVSYDSDEDYNEIEKTYGHNIRQILDLSKEAKEKLIALSKNNLENTSFITFSEIEIKYKTVKKQEDADITYYEDMGYNTFTSCDIFLEVLYDKNKLISEKILQYSIPRFINNNNSIMLPVFYFYNKLKDKSHITNETTLKYIQEKKEIGLFPQNVIKNYMHKQKFEGSIDRLSLDNMKSKPLTHYLKMIMRALYDKPQMFNKEILRNLLQKIYENDNSSLNESLFKRLICYIDMI